MTKLTIPIAVTTLLAIACGQSRRPVKTADGWKTGRVSAARHPKSAVGYSVRFDFASILNADRAEVGEYLEDIGCHFYQSGGAPGAPAYATCDGVTDDATANAKINAILPGLDRLMADLDAGKKIVKTAAQLAREKKREAEAMNCDPSHGGWLSINGTPFRCDAETKRWVIDETAVQEQYKHERHLSDLAFALQSRILTDKEMAEVASLGIELFVRNRQPYREEDMQQRLNGALLQQFRLRGEPKKLVK